MLFIAAFLNKENEEQNTLAFHIFGVCRKTLIDFSDLVYENYVIQA